MKIINLPSGAKLDEFLVKEGKAAFDKLIENAEEYDGHSAAKDKIIKIRRCPKTIAFEKKEQISQTVIEDLKKKGRFLRTDLMPLYFSDETARVYAFEDDMRFRALINDWFGINATEPLWEYLVEQFKVETEGRGDKVEIKKLCFYDKDLHRLYLSDFNGGIYLLDGQQVAKVPNGTDGVLFRDADICEPYFYLGLKSDRGLLDKLLVAPINFDVTGMYEFTIKDLGLLWKVYIYSLFFKDLLPARPLVAFVGEKGSGKSTAIRSVLRFLFGRKTRLHSLSKKEDAFLALVCSEYFVGLDNVDEPVAWLNDHLAALATGAGVALRELYHTNKVSIFVPDVFIALTSRTPRFNRDDVADRMLIFPVKRIKGNIPDSTIDESILSKRNELWTAVINDLNVMVGRFRQGYLTMKSTSRLADFRQVGGNIAAWMGKPKTFGRIMRTLAMGQSLFVLQDDPLYDLLELWLRHPPNQGRRVLASELHHSLNLLAAQKDMQWTYNTPRSLAKRLNNIIPNLRHFFDVSTDVKGGGRRYYTFTPKATES